MMLYKCGMMIFSALQKIFVDLGQPAVSRSMLVYLRVQYFPIEPSSMGWACPQSHCRLLISAELDQAPCVVSIFAGINQMLQALSYYIVGGIAEEALYITIQLQDDVLVSSHISHIYPMSCSLLFPFHPVHFLLRHTAVQTPSGAALSLVGVQVLSYSQRISSEFIHIHPFQSLRRLSIIVNDCGPFMIIHVHSRQIMKPLLGPMVTPVEVSATASVGYGRRPGLLTSDGSGMSWTDRWSRTPTLERRLCSVGFPSQEFLHIRTKRTQVDGHDFQHGLPLIHQP